MLQPTSNMSIASIMDELPTTTKKQDPAQFVQLYRSAMRAIRQLALEAPAAHAVLYVLLERMNQRNALIASISTLAKITGKSRATITRSLSELRKRNYIETLRAGNLSVIVVNSRVAWTTSTVLREKFAVFDAQVIISASEQDHPESLGNEPPLVQLPPVLVPPEIATTFDDVPHVSTGQMDLF